MFALFLILAAVICSSSLTESAIGPNVKIWTFPEGTKDKTTVPSPGAALIGGGKDCDPAFSYLANNANGGDLLVIRASGDDAYNPYIYGLSRLPGNVPLNSVTTINFLNGEGVNDPTVIELLKNAESIFFAGGDQSIYLSFFVGTQVQSIINSKLSSVSVGGTSAGLAVMGGFIYSASIGKFFIYSSLL